MSKLRSEHLSDNDKQASTRQEANRHPYWKYSAKRQADYDKCSCTWWRHCAGIATVVCHVWWKFPEPQFESSWCDLSQPTKNRRIHQSIAVFPPRRWRLKFAFRSGCLGLQCIVMPFFQSLDYGALPLRHSSYQSYRLFVVYLDLSTCLVVLCVVAQHPVHIHGTGNL